MFKYRLAAYRTMFDFRRHPISVFSSTDSSFSLLSNSRPKVNKTNSPYLDIERNVIVQNGGTPTERNLGPDGHHRVSGRPMEVKYATKGRFRINRLDHLRMLSKGGNYILVDARGNQLKLIANALDKYIRYKWLTDRERQAPGKYAHAFVYSKDLPNHFGMG